MCDLVGKRGCFRSKISRFNFHSRSNSFPPSRWLEHTNKLSNFEGEVHLEARRNFILRNFQERRAKLKCCSLPNLNQVRRRRDASTQKHRMSATFPFFLISTPKLVSIICASFVLHCAMSFQFLRTYTPSLPLQRKKWGLQRY